MEVLQNNESQAIIGHNDIFGEKPSNTITPGKSRCVVRGIFQKLFYLILFYLTSRFNLLYIK
jgi:hypothetical protein